MWCVVECVSAFTSTRETIMKQVKILFNDTEQFSLWVASAKPLIEVGQEAAKSMNVQPKRILVGNGVVNLLTSAG